MSGDENRVDIFNNSALSGMVPTPGDFASDTTMVRLRPLGGGGVTLSPAWDDPTDFGSERITY